MTQKDKGFYGFDGGKAGFWTGPRVIINYDKKPYHKHKGAKRRIIVFLSGFRDIK